MTESVSARVRRIISGGVNDLVDAFESSNGDAVMREAVREIERTLGDVRSELGRVIATHAQISRHIELTKNKLVELGNKLTVAMAQDRDDLSEAVIARQLDLERQIPVLEASLKDVAAKKAEMESYIAALNGKKSEMEADLATFTEARRAAGVEMPIDTPAGAMQAAERRADTAGKAFSRIMKTNLSGAGDMAHRADTAQKLAELEQIERSTTISQRLAMAKASRAG